MKNLKCPECKKTFSSVANINRHIAKTRCNQNKRLTSKYLGITGKKGVLIDVFLDL